MTSVRADPAFEGLWVHSESDLMCYYDNIQTIPVVSVEKFNFSQKILSVSSYKVSEMC